MKIGDRFNKVKTGVGGVKTRSMLVVTVVILLIAGGFVWIAYHQNNQFLPGGSSTKRIQHIENLPGTGQENVVYNPLQEKQNEENAQAALATGKSAVPSLLNQGADGYNRSGFGNLNDNTGRCGDECYDQNGFDQQGFDRNGFDKNGFDRNGFDKDGFDKDGFDRQGYDRDGFNRKGCNRQGLNREGKPCAETLFGKDCFNELGKDKNGCDREGKDAKGQACYNEKGFNAAGLNKCGLDVNGFDASGQDCNGCNRQGKDASGKVCYNAAGFNEKGLDRFCRDKDGYDKNGFDKDGFDRNGYDKDGYGRDGFNKFGCNREGKNREGKPCYGADGRTKEGYDKEGYDKQGYNPEGFDRAGFNKEGHDANGYDRQGFDKDGCNKEGKNRAGKPCHGGPEAANEIAKLAESVGQGTAENGGLTPQDQANAQYKRLLDDQRAMQATQMAALTAQQQADLAAQQQAQIAALEAGMTTQAQGLIQAWAPPTQSYVRSNKKDEKPGTTGKEGEAQKPGALPAHGSGPLIYKAGDICFAIIDTSINSDEPGPVMARIVSGPLKGSKVMGSFQRQGQVLMLTFNTLNIPGVPETISFDAVAVDPMTARTALATDVDNHYLTKYVTQFAAAFLQGMGQAVQTSLGTPNLNSSGSATIASTTLATTQDQLIVGAGQVGQAIAADINQANIQPTVTLDAGTGVGLLIMSDLRIEQPKEDVRAINPGEPAAGKNANLTGQPAGNTGATGGTTNTGNTTPNNTSNTTNTTNTTSTTNTQQSNSSNTNTGTAPNNQAPS